jgi:hypothetical protein
MDETANTFYYDLLTRGDLTSGHGRQLGVQGRSGGHQVVQGEEEADLDPHGPKSSLRHLKCKSSSGANREFANEPLRFIFEEKTL